MNVSERNLKKKQQMGTGTFISISILSKFRLALGKTNNNKELALKCLCVQELLIFLTFLLLAPLLSLDL